MNPNRKKRALWAAALLTLLAIGSAFLLAAKAKREIWLSRNGESLCKIATNSTSASPSDKMAAKELADDLRKITGAAFAVVAEAALAANDKAIYVGQTRFARDQGINFEQLGAEESILRTVNGNLILCGGRPRGTLYAVFAFLESLGCRWYTPWHEKMPRQPQLRVALMDKRIKPFMNMRQGGSDFWRDERTFADKETYQRFHQQYQRYLLHNRVNSGVDFGEAEGGCVKSGGRMSNHSFFAYVPAEKYAQDHPEYFSMRDGKRVPSRDGCDAVHLCLTNPDVLKIVIAGVKEDIQKKPEGQYVSVSINDGGSATICDCPACTKAQEDEGVSGLLLQFVNAVADAIRDEHPDKYILTLAYTSTQQPPKRIRARDNVIVWVCRGALSCAVYLPRGKNAMALDALREWGRHASHLWVWDYAAGSFRTRHYFKPITWKMDEQFKLFKELGTVDGIFQENEIITYDELFNQFYEMNAWIFYQLCQDPAQDVEALINDFLSGYYGKASAELRKYVDLVQARLPRFPYQGFFDYDFAKTAEGCFDRAEAAVKDEAELLGRVKDLRLQLDQALMDWRNDIVSDYLRRGGKPADYPFKIAALKERILNTLAASQHPCFETKPPRYAQDAEGRWATTYVSMREIARKYTETLSQGTESAPLPEPFRSMPPERVIDLTAPLMTFGKSPNVTSDPEAALGLAYVCLETNQFPIPFGIGQLADPRAYPIMPGGRNVPQEEVPGKGYHLYSLRPFPLNEWIYVGFGRGAWGNQEHLWSLFDPACTNQLWQPYVSMKVTGPAYPHGNADETNGIWVDRFLLIKRDAAKPDTTEGKSP